MSWRGAFRAKSARLTLVGVGIVAVSLAALSRPGATISNVVQPRSVGRIVAHDYAINNSANASLNYSLQAVHEEGSALAMDNTAFRAAKLSGYATIEGPRYFPFYGRVISSAIPDQTQYPAQFAVLVAQTSSAGTPVADRVCPSSGSLLALRKNTATNAWRVTLEPAVPRLVGVARFATTSSGYDVATAPSLLAVPAASLPRMFVTALNAQAISGKPSSLLPASVFRYGRCGELGLENPHSDVGTSRGLVTTFRASAMSPSDLVSFATNGGGALALFTVQERVTEVAANRSQFVVWSHGATTWWSLLHAGNYAKVSWTIDQELAVAVPSLQSHQTVRIVGADSGVTSVAGIVHR